MGPKFHCLFMSRSCSGVYQFGGGAKRLVISLEGDDKGDLGKGKQ